MSDERLDHGILNVPLSKRGNLDAEIDRHLAAERREARRERRAMAQERRARREAEAARPKLSAGEVKNAAFVRDSNGWHKVVRVNSKSVTVETPWSWTDRIPLARILEVRRRPRSERAS